MRIIGGKYKGRRLQSPLSSHIRPTSDRLRESLFNMIMHGPYPDINGARVLDMFAGTGAFGLEALSRGAAHVTFLDKDPCSIKIIRQNVSMLNVAELTTIECSDATRSPTNTGCYEIIFLDPPYDKNLIAPALEVLQLHSLINEDSLVIVECSNNEDIVLNGFLEIFSEKIFKINRVYFLKKSG